MILRSASTAPFSVEGLSVAYRGDPVLWNVDWSAHPGALTAIVGPNGAGKTTLLNAAIGLVPKLAGRATFWGEDFSAARSRIAYVPQRESVDWDFPIAAAEVVEMGATRGTDWVVPAWARRLVGSRSGGPETVAREALERVGLLEHARTPIGELSGGQQQRVFLARALAQDAQLLLLDEPFAGIDVATEQLLMAQLRELADEGRTVIAVHHDLGDVRERFDNALLLNGSVVATGSAQDVLTPEWIERAYGAGSGVGSSLGPAAASELVASAATD